MSRLLVLVEGVTEETFVNNLLAPHLYQHGFANVSARLMGNARQRDRRGGIRGWPSVRSDITRHLKGDAGCTVTTMVDYYALPQTGSKAWPGRAEAGQLAFPSRAKTVNHALLADIANIMGDGFNTNRFVPYVVMHEFEGLLFSDCELFARGIGRSELAIRFQKIRDSFDSPEEINDSPQTAPSKRVESLVPGYEKPLLGALAVLQIGLDAICGECPNFNEWLKRLKTIGRQQG